MFGENLQKARRAAHMTLDTLAERYNAQFDGKLNKGTLSRYEHGKQQPKMEVVRNLAALLSVSVDELTGTGDLFSRYPNLAPIRKNALPLLGEIAAGEPIFADEDKETYVEVGNDLHADFCLKVNGDSMINARIHDGDIVFIRRQVQVENGEIAAVIINDSATLKRVYYYPEQNKLVLMPENPRYEPFVYVGDELSEIRILGKAVAFQSVI